MDREGLRWKFSDPVSESAASTAEPASMEGRKGLT